MNILTKFVCYGLTSILTIVVVATLISAIVNDDKEIRILCYLLMIPTIAMWIIAIVGGGKFGK